MNPKYKKLILSGIITGQIAGLIMAFAVMAVFALFYCPVLSIRFKSLARRPSGSQLWKAFTSAQFLPDY